MFRQVILVLVVIGVADIAYPACLSIDQAPKHIGDTGCVSGQVLQVNEGPSGTTFINFCPKYDACPFTVVVFPRDLRHVGDVRELAGKTIEIHGPIREYDGRAEIILKDTRQLRGSAARLPPVPKEYDVERRGRYRAGKFNHPKPPRKKPHGGRTPRDEQIPAEEQTAE